MSAVIDRINAKVAEVLEKLEADPGYTLPKHKRREFSLSTGCLNQPAPREMPVHQARLPEGYPAPFGRAK